MSRRLVTDAVRRVGAAIEANQPERPVRFVLMSSAGVRNHDLDERGGVAERAVLALLRTLVPPHADNEQAAEYLRTVVGQQSPQIEWCAVRPDSLVDADEVSPCTLHPSPTRSALFNPGRTSRINVAHVMTQLVTDDEAITAISEPPADTRAYFRGRCIDTFPEQVVAANWDSIVFDVGSDALRRVPMMEPMRGTRAHVGTLFDECESAAELLRRLGS